MRSRRAVTCSSRRGSASIRSAPGSGLGSQILQIERRRVQAGIKFLGPGIDFGYAADRRFDALEPGKQAILGPFQLGSGEKQRIADLRGMRQLGQTGLQLLLLVLRQFRLTQLVQLKGNVLPVAAALLGRARSVSSSLSQRRSSSYIRRYSPGLSPASPTLSSKPVRKRLSPNSSVWCCE